MSSSNTNPQDSFIYGNVWNKHLTLFLVNFLVTERNEGRWIWGETNHLCLVAAQLRLNMIFSTNFTAAKVRMRVRDLKVRWRTFNDILQLSGVRGDRATNIMHVPPEIFTTLVTQTGVVHDTISNRMFVPPEVRSKAERKCGNAQMYFYYGDDRWEALKTIFRTYENTIFPGGPDNPIVIESSSVSSSSSSRPRRQFSNSIDQESAVGDINTWESYSETHEGSKARAN
ncbi:hypothetical protein ACS0TY_027016 [Phlomoides rotata]